jgi:transcription initiation factor IIE alpha subunit
MDGCRTFVRGIDEEELALPYLHCPRCHRTAWLRANIDREVACRHCGTSLDAMASSDARYLAGAVRERFARDARLNAGRKRFIRDPRRLAD